MTQKRGTGERQQARLKSIAQNKKWDPEATMVRYALECLLYRLQEAGYADTFQLKGALSVMRWTGGTFHRPTQDMDLNGSSDAADNQTRLKRVAKAVYKACQIEHDDGLEFDVNSLAIKKQHEGRVLGGKLEMKAYLGDAEIPVRIDVGFGHPVTPSAVPMELETVVDNMPRPRVFLYPLETTIAEKVSAAVSFGKFNTRVRDYYDLWYIGRRSAYTFDGTTMVEALNKTLDHQGISLPDGVPDAFTDAYAENNRKAWAKFVRTKKIEAPDVEDVVADVRSFVMPVIEAARDNRANPGVWSPEQGWSNMAEPVHAPAINTP